MNFKELFKRAACKKSKEKTEKNDYFSESMDWEASRLYQIELSEQRAWKIAFAAISILIVSWITIVAMMPLKTTVPYVVRVNTVTGASDILTTLHDKKITYDDAIDKYWLAKYVRARENYDWYTLQSDYEAVGLLSAHSVGQEYAKLYEGETALDKKNGNSIKSTIDIVSVVPDGKGLATVRFIKHNKHVNDTNLVENSNWVATLSYEYRDPSAMKESLRLINPFGFQVLTYRLDPELMESK